MPVIGWRGNALRFFINPIAFMTRIFETHGNVVRLARGGNSSALFFKSRGPHPGTFFAFGPECNRRILTDADLFESRAPAGPATEAFRQLATNFFFINGERHQDLRRLMMPAFARERLKVYHHVIVDATRRMLDRWAGRERVDLAEELGLAALEISSRCFYGLDPRLEDQNLAVKMLEMINTLFSPAVLLPLDLPGMPYHRLVRNMEEIIEALGREIENKRRGGCAGDDVLSLMVREHDRDPAVLSRDELVGNAFVMFFAGHDTTAKALTWTLFLLATHPRVAAELVEELETRLGGEAPSYEEVFELPLLDRVVKESLRLLSPAVMFARQTTRETELGGFEIPRGAEIIYSPYVTHLDASIFAEPKKFLPDRWLSLRPTPYQYLPFGGGVRTCLGAAFGGAQLRTMVALALQRYRLEIVPGSRIDLRVNVVMAPRGQVPVRLYPQDRAIGEGGRSLEGFVSEMIDFP
ncbi:MAG: cytochrome P450 [Thermoanaerobaculia bacterium]|nr:cytochrome P450 [Thermoanaerobaculia bacterium]